MLTVKLDNKFPVEDSLLVIMGYKTSFKDLNGIKMMQYMSGSVTVITPRV